MVNLIDALRAGHHLTRPSWAPGEYIALKLSVDHDPFLYHTSDSGETCRPTVRPCKNYSRKTGSS